MPWTGAAVRARPRAWWWWPTAAGGTGGDGAACYGARVREPRCRVALALPRTGGRIAPDRGQSAALAALPRGAHGADAEGQGRRGTPVVKKPKLPLLPPGALFQIVHMILSTPFLAWAVKKSYHFSTYLLRPATSVAFLHFCSRLNNFFLLVLTPYVRHGRKSGQIPVPHTLRARHERQPRMHGAPERGAGAAIWRDRRWILLVGNHMRGRLRTQARATCLQVYKCVRQFSDPQCQVAAGGSERMCGRRWLCSCARRRRRAVAAEASSIDRQCVCSLQ